MLDRGKTHQPLRVTTKIPHALTQVQTWTVEMTTTQFKSVEKKKNNLGGLSEKIVILGEKNLSWVLFSSRSYT